MPTDNERVGQDVLERYEIPWALDELRIGDEGAEAS
jgi:hypothetical protein